jgi:hypothetical protein
LEGLIGGGGIRRVSLRGIRRVSLALGGGDTKGLIGGEGGGRDKKGLIGGIGRVSL